LHCQLDLFDKMVKPVLLYGCELWDYGNCDIIEGVHLKFCKMLLHMKSSTPLFMVYGELGRYLLEIDIKIRMVSYWTKFIDGKQSKLSNVVFHCNFSITLLCKNFKSSGVKHKSKFWTSKTRYNDSTFEDK
jgi:hypothetical protein